MIKRAIPMLLLLACSHKTPQASATSHGTALVSTVLAPADATATTSDSEVVLDAVVARLKHHGLSAVAGKAAHDVRSSDARLKRLAEGADADHVVLIEATPEFVSQVAGRYRWSVGVTITIAPRGQLKAARSWSWKIPVFLRFYHQREAHALDGAVPVLDRNLDRALADYLGT